MTTINSVLSRPSIPRDSPGSGLLDNAKSAGSFGFNVAAAALCAAAGVGFGSLESIIPGNNLPDTVTGLGKWGGFGLAGYFLWRLWSSIKKGKQAEATIHPTFSINESLAKNIGNSVAKVSANPNDVLKLSEDLLDGKAYDDTLTEAANLFTYWTNDEFKNIVYPNRNESELTFKNGNGLGNPINLSDLKDRLAVITGYVVGARDLSKAGAATYKPNEVMAKLPKLTEIETENGTFNLDYLVPDEFLVVYSAGKHYKDSTRGDLYENQDGIGNLLQRIASDTSINAPTLSNLTELRKALKGPNSPQKQAAEKILQEFKINYNYLQALQQSIVYVREAEQAAASGTKLTPSRARNTAVLRGALIAGLDLRIKDAPNGFSIKQQLDCIFDGNTYGLGSTKGLQAKVTEIGTLLGQIKESPAEGTNEAKIEVVEETSADRTYGNIHSYQKGESIVFNGLIKSFNLN